MRPSHGRYMYQGLNFSAETRNSAVFPRYLVIPEISANQVKKFMRGGGGNYLSYIPVSLLYSSLPTHGCPPPRDTIVVHHYPVPI